MDDAIALDRAKHRYIGGTDAATIALEAAGKTPPFGRSAFGVWSRLMGLGPPDEDTDRFELGRLMEEPIAKRFEKRTGMQTYSIPMVVHPKYEWVGGHLDRGAIIPPEFEDSDQWATEKTHSDVECKTVGYYQGRDEEWSDPNAGEVQRVPLAYLIQAVWYAGIPRPTSLPTDEIGMAGGLMKPWPTLEPFSRDIYIAAQFDFKPLRVYRWSPDETIRTIWSRTFDACQEFWERYVLTGEPPPAPKDPEAAKRWLNVRFPDAGDEILDGGPRVVELARAYKEAASREKTAKAEKEKLGVELGKLIGSAYGIQGSDSGLTASVSWPTIRKKPYTVNPEPYRALYVNLKEDK